jgi:hypothetical protein
VEDDGVKTSGRGLGRKGNSGEGSTSSFFSRLDRLELIQAFKCRLMMESELKILFVSDWVKVGKVGDQQPYTSRQQENRAVSKDVNTVYSKMYNVGWLQYPCAHPSHSASRFWW